jgi:hypothetical protein
MKLAHVLVTPELLIQALNLPAGSVICSASSVSLNGALLIKLLVEHDSFPEVDPTNIPLAMVEFRRIEAQYKLRK